MSSANGFRIIAWSFLLIIKGDVARGQFPGTNAVALINGQTMLDCLTTVLPDSWWRHTSDGTNNSSTIATGCIVIGNNAAYYRTEPIGGNTCRLTIGNVTMQLGGVYNCFDGNAIIYRNLVTVIDPNASVVVYNQSEIVEDDKLNISCSISYNGPASPAPSLHPSPYWITSPGQIYTSQTYTTAANVVTLVATLTVQRPTVPIFWCNTDFEITEHSGAYNATAPADNFTVGNTTALDVRYGPTQPVIANRSEVITINGVACGISVLNCSSTGNPIPNYRWYDSDVILSTGETLTLGEINRNYTCQAYNKIRNYTNVSSTTYRILVADCNSTVECCVYPRDDTTSITVEGCDNGTLCDCSQGSSGIKLVCSAKTFPNASYIWNGPNGQVGHSPVYDQIKMNGTYQCHAYFDRTLSNYSGDVIFSNGSKEKTVDQCSVSASTIGPSTTTTTPDSTGTQTTIKPSNGKGNGSKAGEYAGIAIACIIGVNGLTTFFFIGYYSFNGNGSDAVNRSGNVKTGRNKIRLNKRFPRLQKMLPCLNDTKETAGANFPWVLLFILLGALTGIVTFPVMIALAIKSETNDETSVLKKGDDTENENTENGRSSPSYPSSPTGKRTKAQPREDPYQNSAGNIELESSPHSRNHHPTDSPTSNASIRGKPPPPPKNKPTVNSPSCPMDYTINGSAALNYLEPTTYAELPIKPGNTGHTPSPVQLLVPDDPSDNYAVLNKT